MNQDDVARLRAAEAGVAELYDNVAGRMAGLGDALQDALREGLTARDAAVRNAVLRDVAAGRDAVAVREFTTASGTPCADAPEAMTAGEVEFVAKMMLDEIMELMATVHTPAAAKAMLKRFVDESADIEKIHYDDDGGVAMIADQADALVDAYYYSLNAACKRGVNLSRVFTIVHAANMAKRDPVGGTFLRRADGKIIKPAGWQPPDVVAEIRRQREQGAWS